VNMLFGRLSCGLFVVVLGEAFTICLSGSPSYAASTASPVATSAASISSSTPCHPPRYKIVKTRWDVNEGDGISMSVVIDLPDFVPERLLCLVDTLAAAYKRNKFVSIDIFSSRDSALTCFPDVPMVDAVFPCLQRHAEYRFNDITKQRYVEILPMGSPTWGGENTSVNLPASTLRPCRLEMSHRCFLELAAPGYPNETLAALISARVVVSGKIDRAGRVEDVEIRVAAAKNVRRERASSGAFVQAVIESVRTWRLEESERETPFNVRFEFDVTDDLSALSLEFQLPHRVIIRGKPSLLKYEVPGAIGSSIVKGDGLTVQH
jgi:hypothetical protein